MSRNDWQAGSLRPRKQGSAEDGTAIENPVMSTAAAVIRNRMVALLSVSMAAAMALGHSSSSRWFTDSALPAPEERRLSRLSVQQRLLLLPRGLGISSFVVGNAIEAGLRHLDRVPSAREGAHESAHLRFGNAVRTCVFLGG